MIFPKCVAAKILAHVRKVTELYEIELNWKQTALLESHKLTNCSNLNKYCM